MESKLWTLLGFLYLTSEISSLPRTEESANPIQNIAPFKISTQKSDDQTVKYVTIKYDEDWNTLQPQVESEKQGTNKVLQSGSETDTGNEVAARNEPLDEIIKDTKNNASNALVEKEQSSFSKNDNEVNETKDEKVKRVKEILEIDEATKDGEELFEDDFAGDPNLTNQAFIPLSPSIQEEDLLKFLASEDIKATPNSYQRFQLASPVQDVDVVKTTESNAGGSKSEDYIALKRRQEDPISSGNTGQSTEDPSQNTLDREGRKTNFQKAPYGSFPWEKIEREEQDIGPYRDNKRKFLKSITESGTNAVLPTQSTREKYQVIRVYAEKPKPEDESKEVFFTEKPSLVLDNFSNHYRRKTNANKYYGDESQKSITKEAWVSKLEKNNFEPTVIPLSEEAALRTMIKNRIKEKMGSKESRTISNDNGIEELLNEIKRSDNSNDADIIDVSNSVENEIDLEDKINAIETQMDKLKRNSGAQRSSKVDRVFENIFKIVKKCQNDSGGLPLYDCLKEHVLRSVESLMFTSNKTVPIVNGLLYLENDLPVDMRETVVAENRGLSYNQKIKNALNMWLNHVSLKVKFPTDLITKEGVNIGRGKKEKYGHLMLLTTLLLMGTMIPIKMGMIATMAGKALTISIISLTLAVIMGLKKLGNGHGSGHTTYEVINVPAGGSLHGDSRVSTYLSRNLKATPTSYAVGQSKSSTSRSLASYHSPYSTFATPYDSEHEGEISPDGTPVTDDETSGGEDEKYYSLSRYSVDPPWRSSNGWASKG